MFQRLTTMNRAVNPITVFGCLKYVTIIFIIILSVHVLALTCVMRRNLEPVSLICFKHEK